MLEILNFLHWLGIFLWAVDEKNGGDCGTSISPNEDFLSDHLMQNQNLFDVFYVHKKCYFWIIQINKL